MKATTKKLWLLTALFMITSGFAFAQELYFNGWTLWGPERGLSATINRNSVTFTGNVSGTAGYVNEDLNPAMRNRVVRLEIKNADKSTFYDGQMVKITVNKSDSTVYPTNIMNLINGYIPEYETVVEFELPSDFDGKLGFVFYQATLRGLEISATYR